VSRLDRKISPLRELLGEQALDKSDVGIHVVLTHLLAD
jgi:hypothetical protein